jgi:hypothetical protein
VEKKNLEESNERNTAEKALRKRILLPKVRAQSGNPSKLPSWWGTFSTAGDAIGAIEMVLDTISHFTAFSVWGGFASQSSPAGQAWEEPPHDRLPAAAARSPPALRQPSHLRVHRLFGEIHLEKQTKARAMGN